MSTKEGQEGTSFPNMRGTPRGTPRGTQRGTQRGMLRGTPARGGRGRMVQNNNRMNRNFFNFPRRNNQRFQIRNQFNRNNRFRFNTYGRTTNYRRLYISNLPPNVNSQILRKLLSRHGRILRCVVNFNRNGFSRRNAFVMFAFPDGARRCLTNWNGYPYNGYTMNVSYRRPFNFGFSRNRFGFGFRGNGFRRGQRRMVFRRNPQRRTAFRRRR